MNCTITILVLAFGGGDIEAYPVPMQRGAIERIDPLAHGSAIHFRGGGQPVYTPLRAVKINRMKCE